jgi:DNA-directed RNA polymerase subunit RPC12/RpoP
MTKVVLAKCRKCGHEFRIEILTKEEQRDPRRQGRPIGCERCGSLEVDVA